MTATNLALKNASTHARFVDYYDDDELRQLVGEFYAQDLRVFNYESDATHS